MQREKKERRKKKPGAHLRKHKGKDFTREKRKMKRGRIGVGQIDTTVKSFKFDD